MNANTEAAIAELAKEMGVTPSDVRNMAIGVCSELEKMKSAQYFIDNEFHRETLIQVSAVEHVKQFERFTTAYLTRPAARSELHNFLFRDLTAGAA